MAKAVKASSSSSLAGESRQPHLKDTYRHVCVCAKSADVIKQTSQIEEEKVSSLINAHRIYAFGQKLTPRDSLRHQTTFFLSLSRTESNSNRFSHNCVGCPFS